jgi:hypothetical protein
VTVEVHRDADLSVAQRLRDHSRANPLRNQDRSARVPRSCSRIRGTAMFVRPWPAAIPFAKNQASLGATEGQLYEYACHEGNYSVVNVLKGARAREKAVEEAARSKQ